MAGEQRRPGLSNVILFALGPGCHMIARFGQWNVDASVVSERQGFVIHSEVRAGSR